MGRKKLNKDLLVYMNGHKVGTLTQTSLKNLQFAYAHDWLQDDYARPISLSLPLREQIFTGEVVYNYFDNLLPDNESLRARIQKRFGSVSNQCFDLLSDIGRDCVGALQLVSDPVQLDQKIESIPVTASEVAQTLRDYYDAPLGMQASTDFRISIAGAQEKTAFLNYKGAWHLPTGSTPTTHIFKLPIGHIEHSGIDLSESVENEWLCLQLLKQFGLEVNHAEMVDFEDTRVLVCQRFDRQWNDTESRILRLPQEDFCQVFGVSSAIKYESDGGPGIKRIMDFLSGSNEAQSDRLHFLKACFIYWLLGAIDGHAKNFSVFIKKGGRFNLTPFYDVMSAYPIADKRQLEWKKLKMAMSVRGKNKHYSWSTISTRHWLSMANLVKLPEQLVQTMIHEVFDTANAVIDEVSSQLPKGFPCQIADSIFTGMKKVISRSA